ncbi:MAG: 16S rRNA (guanine(966)-N(2))-methyltransferase RsmD [Bdellovibrionota bacterium]
MKENIIMILNSGWCKGMKIKTPKGSITRPTGAKIREAFIDILQIEIRGAIFLDLFSGTGAVGLSAISRGAKGCLFVESDPHAYKALRENLQEASRRAEKQEILCQPLSAINKQVSKSWLDIKKHTPIDIVWADPPYEQAEQWVSDSVKDLSQIITNGGFFALECSKESNIVLSENEWLLKKERAFGKSKLLIWQKL